MPKIQKTFWVIYRALKISGKYLFSMQKKILKMGKKKSISKLTNNNWKMPFENKEIFILLPVLQG